MHNLKTLFIIWHIVLAFLLDQFPFISTYYGLFIILLGTYYILGKPDSTGKYPLSFAAYIVGVEVLLRMTGAGLFWEFGKYAVIYFLLLGIIREKKKIQIFTPILYYFFLLLPAIVIVPFNTFNLWRQDVAFNLSGPATLMLCSMYFFNQTINKKALGHILFYITLPIVSMAVYNILTMPNLAAYHFLPYSDFDTSGGYGPNQVSTTFGLGIAGLILSQVLKLNLTGSKIIDILVLITFFALGLITFSRGGIFATVIAFSCAISSYIFHDQKKMKIISKGFGILTVSIIVWMVMVSLTDGVITQRYGLDRNEYGDRFILDLTGRAEIYKIDLEIFIDHIFTGVGPGQAKELREQYGYGQKVAAHTEYSRMLAEHGLLGLLSFLILIAVSSYQLTKSCSPDTKFIKILFGLLALLTMSHSAMRLAMPSFLYGFLFSKYTKEI